MTIPGEDQQKYLAAKAHVASLKGFYIHLTVFIIVMSGLVVVDYANGASWWVQWPLIGWGLGLLAHAYRVFATKHKSGDDWEERKIKETMTKM
ncbi:MAG: 2TM domain-containing protein [Hyphomicrobium sp.]|nr:2TM domain-containing protein [Hyphomicrobium sp.]